MRTTVVPAQITTVEDRVAGNFTFIQIVLLVIPLILGSAIYAVMSPKMHLGSAKMIVIGIQYFIFGVMALRINGKILADWLIIYLRYSIRPRRYIFTKNDLIHREIIFQENNQKSVPQKQGALNKAKKRQSLSILEQIKIDRIFNRDALSISFKLSKKGGVDVSLKQIEN